jgi:sugar phosphate isomerase/epimerase
MQTSFKGSGEEAVETGSAGQPLRAVSAGGAKKTIRLTASTAMNAIRTRIEHRFFRYNTGEPEMHTRRDFGRFALGATAVAGIPMSRAWGAKPESSAGVRLGATTFSLRDLRRAPGKDNVDDVIAALRVSGVTEVDLFSYNTEPAGPDTGPAAPPPPATYPVTVHKWTPEEIASAMLALRNATREWRLNTPAGHYEAIRGKFAAAGIAIGAYTVNYGEDFTEKEIDATFRQAKTLGAGSLNTPGSAMVRRLAPFAERYGMNVSVTDPALASALPSKYFKVNLDIGQVTAANGSPVAYLQENHESVGRITVKDRRRNRGSNEEFGEGDTPIREVLRLVGERKYAFPVYAEYEYVGLGTPAEELKKCMDYMRSALA